MSDIALELKKLGEDLDGKIKQANEQTALSVTEKVSGDLKTEIKNMAEQFKELQQKQYDELQTQIKKANVSTGDEKKESFADLLAKGVEAHKEALRGKKTFELDFDHKAVGDMMLSAGQLAAGIVEPARQNGIVGRMPYFNHVRDFMNTRPTNSPSVLYVRENGGEGAFATVAEGALKPQVDYDLSTETANIRKIAGHIRLSEELIEDVPYITNYVTTRGAEDLRLVEDQQILYGDGTGTNLLGLNGLATSFARAAGINAITDATIPSIIRAAMAQIRVGRYRATGIIMNPIDIANLELTPNTLAGGYLYVGGVGNGDVSNIWRLPVLESDAVAVGGFFVGDFRNGATILDRRQLSVRFYDQDRDNAVKNMVTIVIEERIGLEITRPAAFIKGTFDAAKTAMGAA